MHLRKYKRHHDAKHKDRETGKTFPNVELSGENKACIGESGIDKNALGVKLDVSGREARDRDADPERY